MAGKAVEIEGWRQFRRDVRGMDKQVDRELQADVRGIARGVALEAAAVAPRRTGALAGSYRGTARGTRGIVRSNVFYGRMIEFGFHPRGSSTFVQGRNPIGRTLEREEDAIVEKLGDAVERAADKLGWS